MACDKGVSKLPATCNFHPHVGKVIPAEGLALTDLSIFNYTRMRCLPKKTRVLLES